MSGGPTSSERVAARLRGAPPHPDDLARARMEKRLLEAVREPAAPRPNDGAGRERWLTSGAAVAVAAAAVLFFVLRPARPAAPVARFEVREVDAAGRRGTLEAGSELPTGPTEVAEVRIADSRVRLAPDGRLRIATLASDRLALELPRGEVRVGFHPREPGRQRLSVRTPEARVEVIGTVFTVRARGGATEVRVSEGTVRVVPRDGSDAVLVHAGESTVVGEREARADDQRAGRAGVAGAASEAPAGASPVGGDGRSGAGEGAEPRAAVDRSAAFGRGASSSAEGAVDARRSAEQGAPSEGRAEGRGRAASERGAPAGAAAPLERGRSGRARATSELVRQGRHPLGPRRARGADVASEARTETSAPAAGADGASGTRPGAGGSGSRESALASARSAVAGDSSGSRAALARARRLLSEGRGDLAEPLLRRVAGGAGPGRRRAEAWTLLGDLAQRSGRLEEAARAYGRAAALGRGSMVGPNAIYALARLQERRLRDVGAARRSYARYLTEAPDGPLAPQARRALCRLGDEARCEGAR